MTKHHPFFDALPPVSQFATDDGRLRLGYRLAETGTGLPLVFFHGYNGASASWAMQFSHFKDSRPVLAVDFPGFGGSAVMAPEMPLIADAMAELIRYLGFAQVVVIGHSMGGMLAQWLAGRSSAVTAGQNRSVASAANTGLVAGLVLSCTHKGRGRPAGSPMGADRQQRLADRRQLDDDAYGRVRVEKMLPALGDAELARFLALIAGEARPEGIECGGVAMECCDTSQALASLAAPVQIISAADDVVVKPAAAAALRAALPDARYQQLEGVGHAPYCEDAVAFNRCLESFLATLD